MAVETQRVGVLGPGAVGGVLAARLGHSGQQVTVIATEQTAVAIELAGLELRTPHETLATRPTARSWLTEPIDVLFVATKATSLLAALERTPAQLLRGSTIVPLLNGIDHLPLLRAMYPESTVAAAAIVVEATRLRPGLVEQESPSCELTIAVDPSQSRSEAPAALLSDAGFDVRREPDELSVLWQKLAFLAPYALLTTSARAPIGAARDQHPGRPSALASEAAEAAGHDGVAIDGAGVASRLAEMAAQTQSSMLKDRQAGKQLELDAIAGPILRALGPGGAPATTSAVQEILTQIETEHERAH